MTVELAGTIFVILCAGAGLAVAWGVLQAKITSFRAELSKIWEWKDEHTRDAEGKRREIDREVTELKVVNATTIAGQQEILRRLENIENLVKAGFRNKREM